MKVLLRKISKVQIKDLVPIIKVVITFVPAKIYQWIYKDIWVVTEYPENARDNGYWFFKYIRENYPDKKVFYPIKATSSDYEKVRVLGNVVEFAGWKHYFLFWAATKYIGTTKYHGFPDDDRITAGLFELKLHSFKYVFLNHGFARGVSGIVNAKKTNYDLIIAMSELEKEIITKVNQQPEEKVKAVGFCRHDNLNNDILNPKLIVVMPTWRRWLDYRHETNKDVIEETKKNYLESSYYKEYQALINNERLLQYMEENGMQLVLYLHGYAQMYSKYFSSTSDKVVVAEKAEFFVQDLLKQGAFLVTDYSSVCFDYSYMKKPMLYFQFDIKEFSERQYSESDYYTYENNGFGPIVYTVDDVVDEIIKSAENGFEIERKYLKRVEEFFTDFGNTHCETIYKLVSEL